MLQLRPEISEVVGKSILITGVARSGTTIMGTLVHSLSGVELLFEPPLLYGLLPLLGKIDPKTWKFLYEVYLFEDFLADSLAGRRVNFNRNDDSGVQKVKSIQEVDARLDSRYRRLDLVREALNHRIAYKMPDILPQVAMLMDYYPDKKIVVMFREPDAVVQSLIDKHWFDWSIRSSSVMQGPWRVLGNVDVPFWVPPAHIGTWQASTELQRAYLYWIWQNEALALLDRSKFCLVDYDEFVLHPVAEFQRVVGFLGATPTSITADLLKTVKYQQNTTVELTLDKVSPTLKGRVMKILERLGYL